MNDLVVVLIIAHKREISQAEKESLKQCYKVLGDYPIKLICPEGLDMSDYKNAQHDIDIEFIDPYWQSSYENFSLLKASTFLYNLFKKYKYILFYELDAWVFKDELKEWCGKRFDYIGAPWFEGENFATKDSSMIGVGNGGFSLRNVQTSLKILNRIERIKKLRSLWYRSGLQSLIKFEKCLLQMGNTFKLKSIHSLPKILFDCYEISEDQYWSQTIASIFSDYKVATISDAIPFSFEVNPSLLYKMNGNKLPFGCHAWEKYDPEFWDKYINVDETL